MSQEGVEPLWFTETHTLLIGFILVSEAARALMEKRYAENKNDYKFTLIQTGFIAVTLTSFIATDFFGLVFNGSFRQDPLQADDSAAAPWSSTTGRYLSRGAGRC
nr:DUF4181 domain-containing protein [Bacillus sp. P14.5]